jgi:hypothetical protein
MCVLLRYIFFDFASDATLKDRANVLRFFSALTQDGEFHLADSGDSDLPDALAQAWSSALQRGARNAWLRFENGSRLSLTFGFYGGDWCRWYVMVYDAAIDAPYKQDNVRSLVKSCEIVYRALQPDYGYGLVALESRLLGVPGETSRRRCTIAISSARVWCARSGARRSRPCQPIVSRNTRTAESCSNFLPAAR